MDREQLQGVIGHELGHVRNLDTRYAMYVAVLVGLVALVTDGFLQLVIEGWKNGAFVWSSDDEGALAALAMGLLVGISCSSSRRCSRSSRRCSLPWSRRRRAGSGSSWPTRRRSSYPQPARSRTSARNAGHGPGHVAHCQPRHPAPVVPDETLVEEIDTLQQQGCLTDPSLLKISETAHLIMPYHKAIDIARERLRGEGKIGTTGRGIGPTYEDKMARTGMRFVDLLDDGIFSEKLTRNLHEKNSYLSVILKEPALDYQQIFDSYRRFRDRLAPYVTNTSLYTAQRNHSWTQGAL